MEFESLFKIAVISDSAEDFIFYSRMCRKAGLNCVHCYPQNFSAIQNNFLFFLNISYHFNISTEEIAGLKRAKKLFFQSLLDESDLLMLIMKACSISKNIAIILPNESLLLQLQKQLSEFPFLPPIVCCTAISWKKTITNMKNGVVLCPPQLEREIKKLNHKTVALQKPSQKIAEYCNYIYKCAESKRNQFMLNLFTASYNNFNEAILLVDHNNQILFANAQAKSELKKIIPEQNRNKTKKTSPKIAAQIVSVLNKYKMQSKSQTINSSQYRFIRIQPPENTKHSENISIQKNPAFAHIVGTSPAIEQNIAIAERFARFEEPVFIFGESGVGKELFAKGIHNAGKHKDEPFIAINCAAISENLFESELFGYASGAFTNAQKSGKTGYFEAAGSGTLLLDEITEIPSALQAKLLRVLQEKEFMRVGSTAPVPLKCRIMAATNIPMDEIISKGSLRRDLFHRLHVLGIHIAPLRERKEDIPHLVNHFLQKHAMRYNLPVLTCSEEALTVLTNYSWPGNIRELQGTMERAAILCTSSVISAQEIQNCMKDADKIIKHDEKKAITIQNLKGSEELPPLPPYAQPFPYSGEKLSEIMEERIFEAIEKCNGNLANAAKMLGIHRTTLWRKLGKMRSDWAIQ